MSLLPPGMSAFLSSQLAAILTSPGPLRASFEWRRTLQGGLGGRCSHIGVSLSLGLSHSLSICLSISRPLSLTLPVSLSLVLTRSVSCSRTRSPSLPLSVCLSVRPSIRPSVRPSVCPQTLVTPTGAAPPSGVWKQDGHFKMMWGVMSTKLCLEESLVFNVNQREGVLCQLYVSWVSKHEHRKQHATSFNNIIKLA